MPYQLIDGTVTTPQGFTAAGICCSIKPNNHTKRDLMLLACDVPCSAAGVYTQNLVKSSAVLVTQEHLKTEGHRRLSQTAATPTPATQTVWKSKPYV